LRKIDYPKNRYEVIMIDNASKDDSIRYVMKKFPWVKIVPLDKNYGFGGGYNNGLWKAKGEYLVILNNDTSVEKDWLMELVKVANRSKDIGICGSKIVDKKIGDVGEGYVSLLGIPSQKAGDKVKECFWISDCSMLIKRDVVKRMGEIYDPDYFMYFEEIDVCWRARLLGYKVIYVPKSVVNHLGAATAEKMGTIMDFYHYRNKIWTFRKNTRAPLTQLIMIPVSITTLLTMFYFILKKDWKFGITPLRYVFTKKEKTTGIDKISIKDHIRMFFT
jgi:GT2 family glycosyltransferase